MRGGLISSSSRRLLSTAAFTPAAARGDRLPPGLQLAAARGLIGSHVGVDMSAHTRLHSRGCLLKVSVNERDNALDSTAHHSSLMALNTGSASALPNQVHQFAASPLYTLTNQIGSASALQTQFLPFAASPLYTLANQVRREEQIDGIGEGSKMSEPKGNGSVIGGEQTEGNMNHEGLLSTFCKTDLAGGIPPKLQSNDEIDDSGEGTEGNGEETGNDGEGTHGNGHEGGNEADGTASGNGDQGSEGSGGNGHRGKWDGYENFVLYLLTEQRKAQSAENCKLLQENYKLQASLESFRRETTEKIHKVELLVSKMALKILMSIFFLLVGAAQFALPFTPAGKALRERLKKVLQEEKEEETK